MSESTSSTQRIVAAWIMVAVFGVFCLILVPIALDAGNTEVLIGVGWFALLILSLYILMSQNWLASSRDDSCIAENSCYCERLLVGANKIKQPVNSWSNLGFVISGLVILFMLGSTRLNGITADSAQNPMQTATFFSIVYGLLVIFLGPGSMFFHASMKKWGGWLDNMSMAIWTTFLVVYVAARGFKLDTGIAVVIFLAAIVLIGAIIWFVDDSGKFIFGVEVALWGVVEVIILIANGSFLGLRRTEWYWLPFAGISFGLAFFIWSRSDNGGPWCAPDSWAQGHAAWHLLSALSTFFIFLYLRSEILI